MAAKRLNWNNKATDSCSCIADPKICKGHASEGRIAKGRKRDPYINKRKQVEKPRAAEKSQGKDKSISVASSGPKKVTKRSWVRLDPNQSSKGRAAILFAFFGEEIAEHGIQNSLYCS